MRRGWTIGYLHNGHYIVLHYFQQAKPNLDHTRLTSTHQVGFVNRSRSELFSPNSTKHNQLYRTHVKYHSIFVSAVWILYRSLWKWSYKARRETISSRSHMLPFSTWIPVTACCNVQVKRNFSPRFKEKFSNRRQKFEWYPSPECMIRHTAHHFPKFGGGWGVLFWNNMTSNIILLLNAFSPWKF